MDIKAVIAVINQMQADGVMERYAIGGAVGATFYLEPVATLDVDVFVSFESVPGSIIVSPQRIYDYLTARGGVVEREYIVIAGWPVQFLPPGTPLVEEALKEAEVKDVDGTAARVLTAERIMSFQLENILESKRALRRDLAARPIGEKLRLLDAMRERELAIRGRMGGASQVDASAQREEPVPSIPGPNDR